ncbi:hypothetical protein [Frankia sp. CiP1_Cm_nod2]|uniref:hypothetical protein n=1 Tax=Frankia sp. CiP1_Cm_nod2 TaxID=2897161 RepID=UPI0020242F29
MGSAEELARLAAHLAAVRGGRGRLVSVRGRRQAGKSRLISEFVRRTGLPQTFVTGARQAIPQRDLDGFVEDARLDCTLPGVDGLAAGGFTTWGTQRWVGAWSPYGTRSAWQVRMARLAKLANNQQFNDPRAGGAAARWASGIGCRGRGGLRRRRCWPGQWREWAPGLGR